MFNKIFICFFLFYFLLYKQLFCEDHYTVKELPINFWVTKSGFSLGNKIINDLGQIAGYQMGGTNGNKAAVWDPLIGIVPFQKSEYTSYAYTINELGNVGIALYNISKDKSLCKAIFWNPCTDEVIYGPLGIPYAINNINLLLVREPSNGPHKVWDPKTNTVSFSMMNNCGIDDNGNLIIPPQVNLHLLAINKLGNVLGYYNPSAKPELYLCFEGKNHYLPFPIDINYNNAYLNDKNEVVVLNCVNNNCIIVKWKEGIVTFSLPLKTVNELKDLDHLSIYGFNNNGQILIGGLIKSSETRLYLLTPK